MPHDNRHVDADGAADAGSDDGRVSQGVDVRVSNKQGNVVVGDVQLAFSRKGQKFTKNRSMESRVSTQRICWGV